MRPDGLLTFLPIFKERVWGGRSLSTLFGKDLPGNQPIGESWEITDRPEGVSVVAQGPFAGKSLRELLEGHPDAVLGDLPSQGGRFPWLVKILDAREDLSLQVHPPASKAEALRGEPKTEMWYVAGAQPGAKIHVGVRPGVTRELFEAKTRDGSVAECFHRHEVRAGDVMFVPSGRVHALGGGNVVFEVQQNSDTTYRVFDWNRVGLDGKPRELHLGPAFESIDFEDTLPSLVPELWSRVAPGVSVRPLVHHPLFDVDLLRLEAGRSHEPALRGGPAVVGGVSGSAQAVAGTGDAILGPGTFALAPAAAGSLRIEAGTGPAEVILVRRHPAS